jgi:DnaJ domain
MLEMKNLDYYEFLQISPNADADTIHRVYRFLAARFHPDNPASGDPEKFFMLKTAYDVLSNPESRSKYDDARQRDAADQTPLSTSIDFMDQYEGELNRRLAVLAVLYYRRRNCSETPSVSLPEIEKMMGFPRDYLDFTTWYLLKKGYITRADNSDFTLTADGVDFVEAQRVNMPVLNRMLTSGTTVSTPSSSVDLADAEMDAAQANAARPVIVPNSPMREDRHAGLANQLNSLLEQRIVH